MHLDGNQVSSEEREPENPCPRPQALRDPGCSGTPDHGPDSEPPGVSPQWTRARPFHTSSQDKFGKTPLDDVELGLPGVTG